ncbi:MAG: amidohydrolase family protein [Kiritimatiellae bacterium]|nr:amidohydrolase family protein [Kiritimatiellia bacterium]MDD5519422.1 amidohydrolase family protein [Kiritimatiellia bacterium]
MNTTRRHFLQSAAALTASVYGGCSTANKTGKVVPAKIIDTHVHFYDPSRPQGIPWPPKNDPLLYRTVLPKDYRVLAVPQPVNGVVVVEASPWIEDNQWILDLAVHDSLIVGLVGNLPIGTPEFAGHLKRFAVNPLFRGVRIRNGSLEAGLKDHAFLRDLHDIADRGLCFDVHFPPVWVAQADCLARSVPNLRIIVNHIAGVAVTGGPPPEEWLRLMRTLAEHPQIFMKVSGLVEGTKCSKGDAPVNVEFYQSVLETLWNIFGPDRLVYGSNWPVSARFASLATVQQIAMNFFASKGQAAMDKVFWKNAQVAYRYIAR